MKTNIFYTFLSTWFRSLDLLRLLSNLAADCCSLVDSLRSRLLLFGAFAFAAGDSCLENKETKTRCASRDKVQEFERAGERERKTRGMTTAERENVGMGEKVSENGWLLAQQISHSSHIL